MKILTCTMALLLCAGAHAAPGDSISINVSYDDLDLAGHQDVVTLYSRIERAARTVCGAYDRGDLALKSKLAACEGEAIAAAVDRVHHTQLLAYYKQKTKLHG